MTTKAQKASSVEALRQSLQGAKMTIVSDYRGLTVKEITTLRRRLQKAGADFTVAKNTLVKVALKDDPIGPQLEKLLKGPTALAISKSDPVAPAKILVDFIKEVKKTSLRGGVLEGKVIAADQVKAIAELPSREVLLSTVLATMQAPITGFVRALNGIPSSLVYALEAIRKQKEEASA